MARWSVEKTQWLASRLAIFCGLWRRDKGGVLAPAN